MTAPQPAIATAERKATLFCSSCGHASPPDGDWSVRERDDGRTDLDCPECGCTLVSQPRFRPLAC